MFQYLQDTVGYGGFGDGPTQQPPTRSTRVTSHSTKASKTDISFNRLFFQPSLCVICNQKY